MFVWKPTAAERTAFLAAPRQSDMARLLGVTGRSFRNVTRAVFGAYVSHGDALDDVLRAALLAYHTADTVEERKRIAQEYRATVTAGG